MVANTLTLKFIFVPKNIVQKLVVVDDGFKPFGSQLANIQSVGIERS